MNNAILTRHDITRDGEDIQHEGEIWYGDITMLAAKRKANKFATTIGLTPDTPQWIDGTPRLSIRYFRTKTGQLQKLKIQI